MAGPSGGYQLTFSIFMKTKSFHRTAGAESEGHLEQSARLQTQLMHILAALHCRVVAFTGIPSAQAHPILDAAQSLDQLRKLMRASRPALPLCLPARGSLSWIPAKASWPLSISQSVGKDVGLTNKVFSVREEKLTLSEAERPRPTLGLKEDHAPSRSLRWYS
ncbi:unnamed protein product [Cuscuta europaea]|uniref:Uncharacterized protein n=1 Tax=Cuscuta europaea TaxID=41803 RepID=A0A9P1EMF0_CUSEU|nr:unnamed protein product [Cuscuta europaea]